LADGQLHRVVARRRASHVVPVSAVRRAAFRLLRSLVSDGSAAARWSRSWRGPWLSDMSPVSGPMLGPFETRAEALAAEREWLLAAGVPLPQ
jgi:hypothetical protein